MAKKRDILEELAKRLKPSPVELLCLQSLKLEDLEHRIVRGRDGQLRFVPDPLLMMTSEHVNLNFLQTKYGLSESDIRRYYRGIGYGVSGFLEIFCA